MKPITSKISLVSQVEQTLKLQAKYSAKALEMEETSVVYKKVIVLKQKGLSLYEILDDTCWLSVWLTCVAEWTFINRQDNFTRVVEFQNTLVAVA